MHALGHALERREGQIDAAAGGVGARQSLGRLLLARTFRVVTNRLVGVRCAFIGERVAVKIEPRRREFLPRRGRAVVRRRRRRGARFVRLDSRIGGLPGRRGRRGDDRLPGDALRLPRRSVRSVGVNQATYWIAPRRWRRDRYWFEAR